MRCRMTASLRATATFALRSPLRLASLTPKPSRRTILGRASGRVSGYPNSALPGSLSHAANSLCIRLESLVRYRAPRERTQDQSGRPISTFILAAVGRRESVRDKESWLGTTRGRDAEVVVSICTVLKRNCCPVTSNTAQNATKNIAFDRSLICFPEFADRAGQVLLLLYRGGLPSRERCVGSQTLRRRNSYSLDEP